MKHNSLLIIFSLLLAVFTASCGKADKSFDSELCRSLSLKIENHAPLDNNDYAAMIDQNEAILQYLVERTREIAEMPDSLHESEWRALSADPEYLERFGYMFTIGSALHRAELNNELSSKNESAYASLDHYNQELIEYTDRF